MIKTAPFLDPRGRPADGEMEMIGGPFDGHKWPASRVMRAFVGGRYEYADTLEWAFIWVPDRPHV